MLTFGIVVYDYNMDIYISLKKKIPLKKGLPKIIGRISWHPQK